ncbi:Peroxisomal membrane protein 2 [Carex littledalei]|uniref:Peroxisomal membrane protein 2 n=1 Tax=Carex littledalei TaxID=544730 RepID=A0A833VMK1_9POAL|nr:Peroxisomal membrane protein 2 [Carex littledalei]
MATSLHSVTSPPRRFLPSLARSGTSKSKSLHLHLPLLRRRGGGVVALVTTDDADVIPVQSIDSTDQQDGGVLSAMVAHMEEQMDEVQLQGAIIINEGGSTSTSASAAQQLGLAGGGGLSTSGSGSSIEGGEEMGKMADRAINAAIVLAAGTFAVTKLLTIDHDYWHGWTIFEIVKYAPLHNWTAYEEALKTNPVLAKMMISGIVYSIGDWIAQCYEGKPLFDFDRTRMFRSGIVGFTLHGSLSHYYYHFCEALFPYDDWWVVPAKVAFDQTAWSALWNSIYYLALGLLRFESPVTTFSELRATFWPMLTAGWKLWPFAHLITYGVIPLEQRLLWVDCVELIWVTILST